MERRIQTEQEEYGDKFSMEVKDLCSSVSSAQQAAFRNQTSIKYNLWRNDGFLSCIIVAAGQVPGREVGLSELRGERSTVSPFLQNN